MSRAIDARKLKDQAQKAMEKKQYGKAGELYLEISLADPDDPDWQQRAGEAFRRAGDNARAVTHLSCAAEGYAKGGFLLKAIAVCKVVLQVDAKHTSTQTFLSELYSKRDGGVAPAFPRPTAAAPAPMRPPGAAPVAAPPVIRPQPVAAAPAPEAVPVFPPPQPPSPEVAVDLDTLRGNTGPRPLVSSAELDSLGLSDDPSDVVEIDARPEPPAIPTLAPDQPMDVLPLRDLLGGRQSREFRAVASLELDSPGESSRSGAYEITLGHEDLSDPPSIPSTDPMALLAAPPAPRPAPTQPRIPLLSSLPADKLRHVIERMEHHQLDPGSTILRQGEKGGALYVIVRGEVEIVLDGPQPRSIATLGEGSFFGELAVLTNFPRSATVVAKTAVELLEISRQLVSEIVADSPDVLRTLVRFFRDRLLDRLLSTSKLFSEFNVDDARSIAQRWRFWEFEPNTALISEGERAPGMFLLLCGHLDVRRQGQAIAKLNPGDVCGEISLLTRGAANATISAATKCWVLMLPASDFQEMMLMYPQMLAYVSELADARKGSVADDSSHVDNRVDFI